ncbi:hypothetical protein BC940DRAFT_90162 [Gongronella butleri]|nr:hypothetical protein BC940DRAFT_90162 [Gongronella butleri]
MRVSVTLGALCVALLVVVPSVHAADGLDVYHDYDDVRGVVGAAEMDLDEDDELNGVIRATSNKSKGKGKSKNKEANASPNANVNANDQDNVAAAASEEEDEEGGLGMDEGRVEIDEKDFKKGHDIEGRADVERNVDPAVVDKEKRKTLKNLSTPDVSVPTALPNVKVGNATSLPVSTRVTMTYNPAQTDRAFPVPSARVRNKKPNDAFAMTAPIMPILGISMLLLAMN